jgi:hypothetical protein
MKSWAHNHGATSRPNAETPWTATMTYGRGLADWAAAAKECADEFAYAVEQRFDEIGRHPAMKHRYDRDMAPVLGLRVAIAKAEGLV